mgnify:CR=1 FL=1
MQIAIMGARAISVIARTRDLWTLAGDQLFLDMDLTPENLPPGTRRRRWMLTAAGVMLAAALGSLVWMQSRQFMLLNQASQYTDDYLQISLGQLEAEYLRLQVAWLEAQQQPAIDRERLQLRYDIFVSRIALVETERARRHLAAHAEYAVAVDGLRGFVTAADRVLGPNPAEPLTREALAMLQPRLFELGPPLKTLVLEGMHRISANVSQRHAAVRDTSGHTIEIAAVLALATFGFAVLETRTTWPLIVIDSNGRAYTVKVSDLPGGRGDGAPIATLVEFQDGGKLAQVVTDTPDSVYFFANSGGYGFLCSVADASSRQRAGKAFMSLEKGEKVLAPAKVFGDWIAAASENGRILVFPRPEMKTQSGGRGVIVMALDEGEALAAVAVPADDAVLAVEGSGRGGKALTIELKPAQREPLRHRRARKGVPLTPKLKPERMR